MSLSTLNPQASLSFFELINAQSAAQQQQRSAGPEQLQDSQDGTERLSIDAFIRSLSNVLQAGLTYEQYERGSLAVASRLSQRIAGTTSPFNASFVVRERRRQLALMEDEMDRTKALMEREKERVRQQRTTLVHQVQLLRDRFTTLASLQQQMTATHRLHVHLLSSSVSLFSLQLRIRRRKMIEQLLTIYPLHVVPLNRRPPGDDPSVDTFMIRGIRIPNTHFYQYEEQAATAFSYVAHLVLLIASCYSITLRYRLVYRSSRSYVWDDVVSGSMFPLFWKGVERDRFEMGVTLLNKDIEQIRQAVLDRGEGYGMQQVGMGIGAAVGVGGDTGGGAEGGVKGKGHGTLDNLKALLDILLPNDEN